MATETEKTEFTIDVLTRMAEAAKAEYIAMRDLTGDGKDPLTILAADRWKAVMGDLYRAQGIDITAPWKTHGELDAENKALRGDKLHSCAEFVMDFKADANETVSEHGAAVLEASLCTYLDAYVRQIPADSGIFAILRVFWPHLRLIAEQYAGVAKEK